MIRDLAIVVVVYAACIVAHVVLNYTTNGAWSRLMRDCFPKGD